MSPLSSPHPARAWFPERRPEARPVVAPGERARLFERVGLVAERARLMALVAEIDRRLGE